MKWFLGTVFVAGCGLIWLGNSALNEPNQSPDVRIGGMIPLAMGAGFIVLDVVIAFVWLIARA